MEKTLGTHCRSNQLEGLETFLVVSMQLGMCNVQKTKYTHGKLVKGKANMKLGKEISLHVKKFLFITLSTMTYIIYGIYYVERYFILYLSLVIHIYILFSHNMRLDDHLNLEKYCLTLGSTDS